MPEMSYTFIRMLDIWVNYKKKNTVSSLEAVCEPLCAQGLSPWGLLREGWQGPHRSASAVLFSKLNLREESAHVPPQRNWLGVREGVWACPTQVDTVLQPRRETVPGCDLSASPSAGCRWPPAGQGGGSGPPVRMAFTVLALYPKESGSASITRLGQPPLCHALFTSFHSVVETSRLLLAFVLILGGLYLFNRADISGHAVEIHTIFTGRLPLLLFFLTEVRTYSFDT